MWEREGGGEGEEVRGMGRVSQIACQRVCRKNVRGHGEKVQEECVLRIC